MFAFFTFIGAQENVMKLVALFTLIVPIFFVGCLQNYEIEKQPQNFEEIHNTDFNWKSTSSTQLNFVIPDNDMRKTILVELYNRNDQGEENKSIRQFLSPGGQFSKNLVLANHITKIKVNLTQGHKTRSKVIDKDMISSVSEIYFDETLTKGDLH